MKKETGKRQAGGLRFEATTVRVLSGRTLREVAGGLRRGGGGGGGCCGSDSELKDPYTQLGSCCDLGSELGRPGSCP